MKTKLIISCEHAGNAIPEEYKLLFRAPPEVLKSHRGWDPGAMEIGEYLSKGTISPLYSYHYTRLLIEINRSLDHFQLFSEYSSSLSERNKERLVSHYYKPYRMDVENAIEEAIAEDLEVIHLSVHTFTPVFNGVTRNVQIGLLMDDIRDKEVKFCQQWAAHLNEIKPELNLYFNEPYNGADDGFTTYLRNKYDPNNYLGIELEVSQQLAEKSLDHICEVLCYSLKKNL